MLLAELSHRVKNTLASIQAIATQTLRSAASLEAFETAFSGRVKALALAHGVLTQTGWSEAELGKLIRQSVAPYLASRAESVRLSGPPTYLPPRQVVVVMLMMHELGQRRQIWSALQRRRPGRHRMDDRASWRAAPAAAALGRERRTAGATAGAQGLRHDPDRAQHWPRARWPGHVRVPPARYGVRAALPAPGIKHRSVAGSGGLGRAAQVGSRGSNAVLSSAAHGRHRACAPTGQRLCGCGTFERRGRGWRGTAPELLQTPAPTGCRPASEITRPAPRRDARGRRGRKP